MSKYIYLKTKNKNTFIYSGSLKPPIIYEKFIDKVILIVKNLYVLPDCIEIQFIDIGDNVYGMTMLDPRFPNRIRLNQNLTIDEIVLPLVHELIHLHQIYTNKLKSRKGGLIIWENQVYKVDMLNMFFDEYHNLPWEVDATQKTQNLLDLIKKHK